MRIISGSYRGSKILGPENKLTRPLKDLVKESIFNILEHSNLSKKKIYKSTVLDLFSGSGSFGLECISRGALKVVFVENYPQVLTILKKNIEKFNCANKTKIITLNIYNQQKSQELKKGFDFIFIDPPFNDNHILELIINLKKNKIVNQNSILVIHRHRNSFDEISKELRILKESTYGKSKIIFACMC
tara:strand:- start:1337 stop:1900 length:564 start_codon:yes stop_codon:yes gene_type:complete